MQNRTKCDSSFCPKSRSICSNTPLLPYRPRGIYMVALLSRLLPPLLVTRGRSREGERERKRMGKRVERDVFS